MKNREADDYSIIRLIIMNWFPNCRKLDVGINNGFGYVGLVKIVDIYIGCYLYKLYYSM